jgi:Universal stress protein family
MICHTFIVKLRPNPSTESTYDILDYTEKQNQLYFENAKRILVPVDGSLQSLKALNGAVSLFNDAERARIFGLNVVGWTDDEDESQDGEMTSEIEEEGRKMLRGVVISKKRKLSREL